MLDKRKAALIDVAREKGFFPDTEEPRATMIGQTVLSPLWYLLVGPLLIVPAAHRRMVVATDAKIHVLNLNFWKSKEVDGVELAKPLSEASVDAGSMSLQIDGTEKLYAFFGQFEPMKEIAALADGGREAR